MKLKFYYIVFMAVFISNCNSDANKCKSTRLEVTATAYNSLAHQTDSNPNITAFGDRLKPGMRSIAVSRDLLDLGLIHNTKVKLEGFDSLFVVKDKMNKRWKKRIDIYMGNNEEKARQWGRRKINIEYCLPVKTN
jgi:3D (Asp-Asp-Asp) domain-containing protein